MTVKVDGHQLNCTLQALRSKILQASYDEIHKSSTKTHFLINFFHFPAENKGLTLFFLYQYSTFNFQSLIVRSNLEIGIT